MDTKSKILFWVVATLIVLSISASYYRYMVLHDYIVEAQIDCDPQLENCFVWQCDIEIDGECSEDPEQNIWYYKYLYRNAKNIPLCDPADEQCTALTCPDGEAECEYVTCTPETLLEYEVQSECSNPSDFQEEETLIGNEEISSDEIDGVLPDGETLEGDLMGTVDSGNSEEVPQENIEEY